MGTLQVSPFEIQSHDRRLLTNIQIAGIAASALLAFWYTEGQATGLYNDDTIPP